MDLLSVLDQRHRDQNSEARMIKNSFWCSVLWTFSLIVSAVLTAPAIHPKRSGSFFGLLLSMLFLISMAGVYMSMMKGIHSLTTLRLPSSYGGGGMHTQLRFLLPSDHGRVPGIKEYLFYGSFVCCGICGFSLSSSFLFLSMLTLFCCTYVAHVFPLYS